MKVSRLFNQGVRFFLYSNLFISCCILAYTAKTALLLYGNNGSIYVNTLAFSATLLFYCFHRINKRRFLIANENMEERNNWMSQNKTLYYILIALASVSLVTELFFMPFKTYLVFVPVGILGLGYTFPVIPTKKGLKRLRDISWLKTLWIAFAFSWLTSLLPVIFITSLSSVLNPSVLFILFRNFLFLFAICIPFDIRDMSFDKTKGVHTLPVIAGAKTSIYIAITSLLIFIALVCTQFLYFNLNIKQASALLISAFLTIIALFFAEKKRPAIFYPLLFDGAMLLQWILVFASFHI